MHKHGQLQMHHEPRHILVIDDDPDFLEFLVNLLRDEGSQVAGAASITVARSFLAERSVDLIVSDLLMWRLSPEELLATFEDDALFRGVPILVCTAATREAEAILSLQAARSLLVDVLLKPFDIDDLLDRITRLLARRPGRSDPAGWGGK